MKITVLAADTAINNKFKTDKQHSFFIHTGDRNFLYGFGESDAFLTNMEKCGIHSDVVDTAFLESPTIPKGGGLGRFFVTNRRATIYVRLNAFDNFYKKGFLGYKEIGTDKALAKKKRIIRCKNYFLSPDERFATLSYENKSGAEDGIFQKVDGAYVPDDCSGDMYLLVPEVKITAKVRGRAIEEKSWVLFVGQARVGFMTVVEHVEKLLSRSLGGKLRAVVGGLNLTDGKGKLREAEIEKVKEYLKEKDILVFTGGSTGKAFDILKAELGDKIDKYAVGQEIEL